LVVTRHGRLFEAIDSNFWGVTFADGGDRFYATLASGGRTYLIERNVNSGEARVLKENVERPSLSPDGSRLVFKKRFSQGLRKVEWQPYVLDLATMAERSLAETRTVDDQVEWFDASHVIYSLKDEGPPATIRPDLWAVSVDTDAAPQRLWTSAMSPAVIQLDSR
jgi:hypothetical protein